MIPIAGGSSLLPILLVVIFLVIIINTIKNRGIIHLSLSKFTVNPEDGEIIVIEGRKTGLIQWILVQLKLGNRYKITVKNDHITYSEDSAAGKILSLVPIHKISSTGCGYRKPIILLFLSILAAICSIIFLFNSFLIFLICIILAALFLVLYIYMKNFFISIETTGSTRLGFSFKKSFIENVSIDIEKIESAIEIINNLVIKNK